MGLSGYNLTFVHIKGTDNILADIISRVKDTGHTHGATTESKDNST